ncbi:SDR family NAD(P)-dependent oxidoreductase [Bauldia sp.]|uniref:SDR family NAD(P)-dependent oxidoreductase n=1 Tax=Bauldia sp. TaxID=2575872 RepID=UPI003BAAFBFD
MNVKTSPLTKTRTAAAPDFSGVTVLLTGGAGGLGVPVALGFADAGATVVVIDVRDDGRDLLRPQTSDGTGQVIYEQCDLADEAFMGEVNRIVAEHGVIDVLINNAAVYPARPFEDFTFAEYRLVQEVNVDAHVQCAMAVLPGMRDQGWGRVINVSSVTFYGGWDKLFPYVASKGALIGLTRAWARELGQYGVTVNAVAPGAFPTDAEMIHPDPEKYNQFILDRQALKRRGHPSDIANIMMFLASDQASFITGQTINVDGGWVMQ